MGLRHRLGLTQPDEIPGVTLDQVRKMMAEQAHGEVMRLARGQRLTIERNYDDRTPFTVTVESMGKFPRAD